MDENALKIAEHALYPLLSQYLWEEFGLFSKHIDEKQSSNRRGPNGNCWPQGVMRPEADIRLCPCLLRVKSRVAHRAGCVSAARALCDSVRILGQRSCVLFLEKLKPSVRRVVRDQNVGDRRERMELIGQPQRADLPVGLQRVVCRRGKVAGIERI